MEKLTKLEQFRHELNRVFDDNLHTKQWHNYFDYAIIGLIVISTIEVFLTTYDGVVERYGKWLHFVDVFTTIFFTVEEVTVFHENHVGIEPLREFFTVFGVEGVCASVTLSHQYGGAVEPYV